MQFPERPGWLQDVNSMLVSATCHLTILIVLGLMTVAGTGSGHGDSLIMNLGGNGGDAGAPAMAPLPTAPHWWIRAPRTLRRRISRP